MVRKWLQYIKFKLDNLSCFCLAGQERFRSITRSYYRNSVGALLLYDTSNYDSFEHVADWLTEAKRQIEPNNVIFMLVGTKVDKEHLREVPTEQAQQFADYHNLLFMETSSKCGLNVDATFKEVALKIYELLENGKFKLQEGWDGIKSGYMNSNRTLPINLNNTSDQINATNEKINAPRRNCC
jgi:Ras-related protein Rab-39B